MTGVNRERLKETFAEALEREGEERDRFVTSACKGDPALLAEARRLLAAHDRTGDFLSAPAVLPLLEADQPPIFESGRVVANRFRIVRFIARGGMGEVYEAEDLLLAERVALKTFRRHGSGDEELDRMKQEIHTARSVTHPNICRTLDVAEHDDPPLALFTMELLEGPTLSQYLREQRPFTHSEALPLIRQIAAGLQAAHDAGVIHRDFKSGNVILTGGPDAWRPVITDFGLALSTRSGPAPPAVRGGTPGYMAPELLEGGPATPAVDVYALGVVIARMIGARQPIGAQQTPSQPGPYPDVAAERRRLGPWRRVVERCLAKNPADRYQRPSEVAAALDALTGDRRRNRALLWAALLLAAAVGAWFLLSARLQRPENDDPAVAAMLRRQIPLEQVEEPWQLSPDGRSLILTDYLSRNLVLFDLSSGQRRVVVRADAVGLRNRSWAAYAVFSASGERLAYSLGHSDLTCQIRSVRLDGTDDRLLYSNQRIVSQLLLDWSPDGKRILAQLTRDDGQYQYVILSAETGSVIFETPFQEEPLGHAVFHHDGHQVVYNAWQQGSLMSWDIRLLSPDTGRSSSLLMQPWNDRLIGWSGDRRQLVFVSDRTGSNGIWVLPFSDNGVAGEPRQVAIDVGPMDPISLCATDTLLYSVTQSGRHLYTAEIDVDGARVFSGPSKVEWPFGGTQTFPSWSADGGSLSFLASSRQDSGMTVLGFVARDSGRIERVLFPGLKLSRPQWLGETGWVVGQGIDSRGRIGIFRLNPATRQALLFLDQQTLGLVMEGIWSRSGKIHFNRYGDFKKGLFRFDTETGRRRVLYIPLPGENLGRENLALSPDERTLAFQIIRFEAKTRTLMLIPAGGGTARPLWTIDAPDEFWLGSFAWSRDGRYILAVRTRDGKSEIWRVPADGGAPQRIEFPETKMMMLLRMNPDGKTIAFGAGEPGKSEVWILEKFLPKK